LAPFKREVIGLQGVATDTSLSVKQSENVPQIFALGCLASSISGRLLRQAKWRRSPAEVAAFMCVKEEPLEFTFAGEEDRLEEKEHLLCFSEEDKTGQRDSFDARVALAIPDAHDRGSTCRMVQVQSSRRHASG
jgi:hypothetical protein